MRGLPREGTWSALKAMRRTSSGVQPGFLVISAITDERHVIRQIDWSHSKALVDFQGELTVDIGGVRVWSVRILEFANPRPRSFKFRSGLYDKDNLNQEVVVTAHSSLATSGTTQLNVLYE